MAFITIIIIIKAWFGSLQWSDGNFLAYLAEQNPRKKPSFFE